MEGAVLVEMYRIEVQCKVWMYEVAYHSCGAVVKREKWIAGGCGDFKDVVRSALLSAVVKSAMEGIIEGGNEFGDSGGGYGVTVERYERLELAMEGGGKPYAVIEGCNERGYQEYSRMRGWLWECGLIDLATAGGESVGAVDARIWVDRNEGGGNEERITAIECARVTDY